MARERVCVNECVHACVWAPLLLQCLWLIQYTHTHTTHTHTHTQTHTHLGCAICFAGNQALVHRRLRVERRRSYTSLLNGMFMQGHAASLATAIFTAETRLRSALFARHESLSPPRSLATAIAVLLSACVPTWPGLAQKVQIRGRRRRRYASDLPWPLRDLDSFSHSRIPEGAIGRPKCPVAH